MRKITILFLLSSLTLAALGQDTLEVVEKSIKVGGSSTKIEYYGFAEGDIVIFNLVVEDKKDLKDVTISEYPNSVKFADHKTQNVKNKVVNIYRNSVYAFEYHNSNLSGRTVQVKIQRIPKSEATKFFNTNIKWVNKVDTSYYAKQNTYIVSSDTSFVNVIDSKVRVHSQSNASPNRTLVDFTIPANTINWTYWVGVGNESQEAFKQDQDKFLQSAGKLITSINPLAGLAVGLFSLTQAKVGENVKYSFLSSPLDAQKFNAGQPYMQLKSGNVVTDFGLINYPSPTNQKYYIGLENDNIMDGIDVNIKILAVVVKTEYNTFIENVPTYTNMRVPVIKDYK